MEYGQTRVSSIVSQLILQHLKIETVKMIFDCKIEEPIIVLLKEEGDKVAQCPPN